MGARSCVIKTFMFLQQNNWNGKCTKRIGWFLIVFYRFHSITSLLGARKKAAYCSNESMAAPAAHLGSVMSCQRKERNTRALICLQDKVWICYSVCSSKLQISRSGSKSCTHRNWVLIALSNEKPTSPQTCFQGCRILVIPFCFFSNVILGSESWISLGDCKHDSF